VKDEGIIDLVSGNLRLISQRLRQPVHLRHQV